VLNGLPSVFFRTLGKESLCRLSKKHSKKTFGKEIFFDTRQRPYLPRSVFFTLGKEASLTITCIAECQKKTLAKKNFKSNFKSLNEFKSKKI